jgi:putative phosphoribosyl transferase
MLDAAGPQPEGGAALRTRFLDRAEGGARLAEALLAYRGAHPLVLGIPRGGVVTAAEVARRLDAELDVVVARKLGAPTQPELAIGAVTANGGRYLNDDLIGEIGVGDAYIEAESARKREEARERERRYRGDRPPLAIAGRVVIVVDDGLATGATMRAALRSVRAAGPARLIAAIPVGAKESCDALAAEADEVVCVTQPDPFYAVGMHYEQFAATSDDEVCEILAAPRPLARG